MNSLADWLAVHADGLSYLEVGGLGNPGLEHAGLALRAGARRAVHMEPAPHPAAEWAPLRAACAEFGDRFAALTQDPRDGHALLRKLPHFDIVHATLLFHERDPFLLLERLSRHAKRYLVVNSVCIPEGLAEGAAVPGYLPGDPRLEIIRGVLEARGVMLEQFRRPPDHVEPNGIATWGGMWNWFQTAGALRALVEHHGWRITHAWPSWGDLGLTLLAERAVDLP